MHALLYHCGFLGWGEPDEGVFQNIVVKRAVLRDVLRRSAGVEAWVFQASSLLK